MTEIIRLIPGFDPYRDADGFEFDEAAAQQPIDFFHECLRFIEGDCAGKPFVLEPWQQAIVANLYGWKSKETGLRRFREVFIYVARKNGKSALLAGMILYEAFCGGEPGAQIYSAAAEKEQAALVYRQCAGMIAQEPELASRCKVFKGQLKVIEIPETNTIFKAINRDAGTKHGFNTQMAAIDELHAHKSRDLTDVLLTSMGARSQPIAVLITTADYMRESICNEKYGYACRVRDGIVNDPAFLPVVYELGPDDDWTDEEQWKKANPNLGVSISLEFLRRECKRAQDEPSYENTFRRLHCNQRTEQAVRWLQMEKWDACGDDYAESDMEGRECWAGLDLASTSDLTAFVMVFPWEEQWRLLARFWTPAEKVAARRRKGDVSYQRWIAEGWLTLTEGNETDYERVRADINALADRFGIRQIAADRLWQGAQLCQQLAGDGFDVLAFGQGFLSMAAPTKQFEVAISMGALRHNRNPLLRWMAGNVSVESDSAGNIKPSRKASTEKIDGIVASIMGLALAQAGAGEAAWDGEILAF